MDNVLKKLKKEKYESKPFGIAIGYEDSKVIAYRRKLIPSATSRRM